MGDDRLDLMYILASIAREIVADRKSAGLT
jgi:hypothetical protein